MAQNIREFRNAVLLSGVVKRKEKRGEMGGLGLVRDNELHLLQFTLSLSQNTPATVTHSLHIRNP